jgi:hypothetical protein
MFANDGAGFSRAVLLCAGGRLEKAHFCFRCSVFDRDHADRSAKTTIG